MIYITGDYHGGRERAKLEAACFPQGQHLSHDDYLLICGDFGLPWTGSRREAEELAWLDVQPWTTLFVDGNHECFARLAGLSVQEWRGGQVQRLEGHPNIMRLMRGQVFDLDGARVFTMGGAASVDRDLRVEGVSWFAEELPGEEEFELARHTLERANWQVDYVVSHTCSTRMLSRALYPDPGWDHPQPDRLTAFFDELEDRLAYRRWYFGHFHHDRDLSDRHTVLYQQVVPLGEPAAN